jgi:predicted Zn-dependent protease
MGYESSSGFRVPPQLIVGVIIACISLVGYCSHRERNPVTGRVQSVALTPEQEVVLGLQAAPHMVAQFDGESRDAKAVAMVKQIGAELLANVGEHADPYQFEFHLLGDRDTINAFALPGGQVFITEALYARLKTKGQLAGVLGHEIGHVFARHSAEQMAKEQLTQGLVTGAAVGGAGRIPAGDLANFVGRFTLLKYSRDHELESDRLGVRFMAQAGYDPRAMIEVMTILEQASGGSKSDFASTHPSPVRRKERLAELIAQMYPKGVPAGMRP